MHAVHFQVCFFKQLILFLTRGRPDLPLISSKKNLDDYVTERSALLLERFCPGDDAWLTKNPPLDGIPEYKEAKIAIRPIVPVNTFALWQSSSEYVFIFLLETYFASILAAQMRKKEASKKD